MAKIVVLGAGMVGRAMANDLAQKYQVTVADINEDNLKLLQGKPGIVTRKADLSQKSNIQELIKDCDLVVNAVPGFMGYKTTKAVIGMGKNIVDISFFPENGLELEELAKEKGVIAVIDCGVAPGMGNVILGHHNAVMEVESYECYVGGLPFRRTLPFQYKAPFSPIDVIEEYIRPARYIRNKQLITIEALTEPEFLDFAEVGTLEAFNTDGLRSLLFTMDVPNMIEKTMRYPGHIDYMKMLRAGGFFSEVEIEVKGKMIKPIDLTAKLLIDKWKLGEAEPEYTVMRIKVCGTEQGERVCWQYDLFDRYDEKTGVSSMARTTGYSATSAVELVLNGDYKRIGISPPEFIGAVSGCLDKMLAYQKDRGVIYNVGGQTFQFD
ncbi:MAG: saccharopine dehydrogenase NADP-binding domain-containing protein [Candidatus Cloacimonetes bacterium]|nr:saccharopine dehydrogenase NADP-binding domain-containing protein [Candidatus Cloacimonadota bacterium]